MLVSVVTLLLLLLVARTCTSMRQKAVTVDEITYIATGYYHLRTGDFTMNMTNPPLIKMLSALPLLAISPGLPVIQSDPAHWSAIEEWRYARRFLYDNRVDADRLLFLSRLSIVGLSVILGFYLFLWSRALYGAYAGLFALFLYSFSPNILAHSQLSTQDLGLTALMFISTYYFWRYTTCPKSILLLLCGVLFGTAVITKSVGLFLLPIFALYGLVNLVQKNGQGIYSALPGVGRIAPRQIRLRQLLSLFWSLTVIGLIGILVINAGYGFQGTFSPIPAEYRVALSQRVSLPSPWGAWVIEQISSFPLPFPAPYIRSLIFQFSLTENSGGVYFAGDIYPDGLWYLMPVSFLLKTPIPVLILWALSLILWVIQPDRLNAEWLMFIFITVIVLLFVVVSNVNVGVRYLLPIYPFIHLSISRLLRTPLTLPLSLRAAVAALSVWYVISSLTIHPHYLAYFNEIVGGPQNGYKYLADSNIDWGQDLKALKRYMDEHQIETVKLAYFGSADANYYGINYEYLPSVGLAPQEPNQYWWYEIDSAEKKRLEPQTGTIAVSANIVASPGWLYPLFHSSYEWLRAHEPVDQVGYSILIYEIE